MDAVEQLSFEAAHEHTLLVCEHRHRYEFARELCREMRVLDLCCGSGYGSELLAESAKAVIGIDNDDAVIRTAQLTLQSNRRIEFETADAASYLAATSRER